MLFTATTLQDSPDNVRFFVAANLASGVDHMFVFLDSPREPGQQEVADFLESHDRVTYLRTGKGWWGGDRPSGLNVRQRVNANWARAVLEPFDWAEWLFHLDGDEVALLDPAALAAVPDDVDAVWLPPLEAVSQLRPEERPTRFKRLLDRDDLNLLRVLGVLESPTNQAYFHGHVMGKSGVRPGSGLGLTLHDAVSPDGVPQPRHSAEVLRLLHYDAVSGEAFVRKWSALARAGHARYRASRAPTARALKTLVDKDLSEEVREKYLHKVYELTTLDDVDLLDELGLLEEVDPEQGGSTPRDLPAGGADALAARVEELRAAAKRPYYVADAPRSAPDLPAAARRGVRRLRRMAARD
ncbi:glycosyltransferase family 2 protein [Nocardioides sp. GXQ0305]|uniref:glycosyltransferase family 2 protein n=1 Tax=Nocardioides sp. GXQ0305 TaxID=3423912 RepID=UPI003D7EB5A2